MTPPSALPPGVQVFERGWLSANNVLMQDEHSATLVDSGYVAHQAQTLALVQHALQGRTLDQLANTHLHSDHCGGNRALQAQYPALKTWIPPGLSQAVQHWREEELSYQPTGQNCPAFAFTGLLQPGHTHRWADMDWQVHAAPGHDPHSVILFAPEHRLLMSADALWQNGFGVVFPELEGLDAFDEVAQTLDLIERLNPATIKASGEADAITDHLTATHTLGTTIGVQGTPAFVIGETMIPGADIEALKAAIEDARRNANKGGPKAG
jgi:glyoxylase-like metal-dependent hydrolase (beta-lactamase superfamily II)